MEVHCFMSHGVSFNLHGITENSDIYKVYICSECNHYGYFDRKNNMYRCLTCKSHNLVMAKIPYTFKLFCEEIAAIGIDVIIKTEPLLQ